MLQKESLEYHVRKAIEHASKGGIVVTIHKVFGGGGYVPMCSIYSEEGIGLIREIKKRPKNMPFNVLVTSIGMANCIGVINDVARDLLERYAASHVSVVVENRSTPSWVTGEEIP
jgi:tRNA A37 threonylcarbamoyladenosine synthetase subunit TsaC/SUA5/YrdC